MLISVFIVDERPGTNKPTYRLAGWS